MTGIRTIATRLGGRLRATRRRMRAQGQRGSAIVEFAMIAPVFFILLMGIVENGVIYFASSTLQYATDNAARYIRTGQAQAANTTQAQLRTRICNDISPLLSCNSNLQIDVQAYTGYSSANFVAATDTSGNLKTTLNNYQPGTACNVVLVRSFYVWTVITPVLSQFLTNMTSGKRLISGTAAFRNEPFTSSVSGC